MVNHGIDQLSRKHDIPHLYSSPHLYIHRCPLETCDAIDLPILDGPDKRQQGGDQGDMQGMNGKDRGAGGARTVPECPEI